MSTDQNARDGESEQLMENIIEIYRKGRVKLIVGRGSEKKVFLVGNTFLENASHVFEAMFDPRWAEGKALARGAIAEVTLEDDDPEAMELLLRGLHDRLYLHAHYDNPGADILIKFCVVCDKYYCTRELYFVLHRWFATVPLTASVDMRQLLVAAMKMRQCDGFRRISKAMAYHGKIMDRNIRIDRNRDLPSRTIWFIHSQQGRAERVIKEAFMTTGAGGMAIWHLDEISARMRGVHPTAFESAVRDYVSSDRGTHGEAPSEEIGDENEDEDQCDDQQHDDYDDESDEDYLEYDDFDDEEGPDSQDYRILWMKRILARAEKAIKGVCIVCLRQGSPQAGDCRMHTGNADIANIIG